MTISQNIGDRRILFSDLSVHFKLFLEAADDQIHIIAPFIQEKALRFLSETAQARRTTVITTWKPEDILKKVSDPGIYPYISNRGWRLYINNDLHAKCIISDMKRAIFTSSNITGKGLGMRRKSNIECAVELSMLPVSVTDWVNELVRNSVMVDDAIYDMYECRIGEQPLSQDIETPESDRENSDKSMFLLSSLPFCDTPESLFEFVAEIQSGSPCLECNDVQSALHDIRLFGLDITKPLDVQKDELKEAFFSHPFIRAFCGFIGDGKFFGESKKWLQSACIDRPTPFRKQLTNHIRILFDWLECLSEGLYIKTRPHYSERLVRIG